jgi:hypothetical protein
MWDRTKRFQKEGRQTAVFWGEIYLLKAGATGSLSMDARGPSKVVGIASTTLNSLGLDS